MSSEATTHQRVKEAPVRPISIQRAGAGAEPTSLAVMWRVRVAESGRVFEIPVYEKTEYVEFMKVLMVLPGVPSSPQDAMYLVGPAPYRLLTSKKFASIIQSGERGQVFLYNVSQPLVQLSPVAEPTDRSNKSVDYIQATSVKIVERTRQHMLEQEVQFTSINALLIYAASSLDSFYKSFFEPVEEKLGKFSSEIEEFDRLMLTLADMQLHPALLEIGIQQSLDALGSSGGGVGGVSRGSGGSGTSSPAGSLGNTPRSGTAAENNISAPTTELPASGGSTLVAVSGGQSSASMTGADTRRPRQTLLDCINAESWKLKRDLFETSCNEIRERLYAILTEYNKIAEAIPKPFILRNVHTNMASLFRITSLLRNITKQPTQVARNAPPKGILHANPSPMATGLPEIPANDALRDILRHSEKKQDSTASSYSNGEIESIISSVLVSAAVAAGSLVFDTTVSTSVKDTDAGGRFVDEDPTDVISLYVAMERSLQQQFYDAENVGCLNEDILVGSIYIREWARGNSRTDLSMELVQDFGDISQSASLAHTVEVMLRRRHRLDQMAKAVDFFKDRVSDEVVRVSRAVRDVKVGLKHIEKSETVKFLKLWKEGKNEHSAKLNFLKNYPESYRNYLNEVSRIRNFNETLKSKIDDIKKIQFEEFNARKSFWETNMRFLPPFLIDLVPAIRRPPLMLVGPGGFPGLDETLPDLCVSKQEDSNIAEVRIADVVEPVLVSDLSSDSRLLVDKSKLAMSAEITIKMLEEQVAEKDRELELLKIKAKDNVRRENELRDLQNLLEPFHLGVLKQYLGIRTVTSTPHSLQSLDESGLVVSGESREVDIPSAESICAKLIKAMEIEEHTSISTMQALLASTSYLKNDLVEDADASSMDTSLLRQIHIQNLEAALEKFSQIIQHQARIIKSNQSMPR